MSEKFRDRKFVAVLYPEDSTHAECIEKLKAGGYNFAAILHDNDVYEDGEHQGELKRPTGILFFVSRMPYGIRPSPRNLASLPIIWNPARMWMQACCTSSITVIPKRHSMNMNLYSALSGSSLPRCWLIRMKVPA